MSALEHVLERTVLIHAAPETVFRYFTDSARWMSPALRSPSHTRRRISRRRGVPRVCRTEAMANSLDKTKMLSRDLPLRPPASAVDPPGPARQDRAR